MRKRKELYVLLLTGVVLVVVFIGFLVFDVEEEAPEDAPEDHNLTEQAPEDVQEPPPSATGDMDEP